MGLEAKGLTRVLDLTDAKLRRKLKAKRSDLTSDDWRAANARGEESLTQAMGRAAHEARFQAVYVPSARVRKGGNLVVFPGGTTPPLTVLKKYELDPYLK